MERIDFTKAKKQFIDFLINIGTSGKYAERKESGLSDYIIRYILMNCILVFGSLILVIFAVWNIRDEVYSDAVICIAMVLICTLSFILGRSRLPQFISGSATYISYALMCIALVWNGKAQGVNYVFIYLFPSLAIMQFGLYFGAAASLAVILIMSLQMFASGLSMSYFNYNLYVSVRVLVGYVLVLFATIVVEITRKTKDRMIKTQNEWLHKLREEAEEANRRLETAVTERTRELKEQTRIAIDANRAKSQFLATMSHEIRTPLNAVIGLSEIELRGKLPESSRSNVQQIYQSGSSLLRIINDILDISKIEAGSFELVPVEYETASLINDTVNLNRVRLGSKTINFVLEIGEYFPRKLIGDELRVKQVLNNLLSNAIKYTEKGTITLSADCFTDDAERELYKQEALLRFTIRDTGAGIRRESIDKLFSSYTQLDARANRKIEGTGLGLAITKNLVEMMDGRITVESEYGKGSVFTAEIVQRIKDSAGIGRDVAESLRGFRYVSENAVRELARSWMPDGKVLVVDDMLVNIKVARGLLEPYGLRIDSAVSGQKAIEMITEKTAGSPEYDLVFMDHMMPGMDGIEATSLIRAWEKEREFSGRQLPVIALTANAVVGMREMFLEKGFNDYLTKPIDILKLDEILMRWIPREKILQGRPDEEAGISHSP